MNHEIHETHEKIIYKDECYQIQGAIFDVYKEMGCGFLETVYQKCFEIELHQRKIPYEAKKELTVFYKNEPLELIYIPDIICYNKIIVELTSIRKVSQILFIQQPQPTNLSHFLYLTRKMVHIMGNICLLSTDYYKEILLSELK